MTIEEAIKKLSKTRAEIYCKICTVDEIDEDARTVDVSPLDESAPILGVNLQANQCGEIGLVTFPKKDSHVVVGFLNDAAAVVLETLEVYKVCGVIGEDTPVEFTAEDNLLSITIGDTTITADGAKQITMNGGDNGGLVQVQELTDKLNNLTKQVNAFVKVFNSHDHVTTATVGTGGPGKISPPASPASDADDFKREDYENTDVKH